MPPRKQSQSEPWLLLIEFPCWQDADAARELIREGIPLTEEVLLRPKNQHPSDGNIASWRTTVLLREAFGQREFDVPGIEQILLENGYNMQGSSWLSAARRHGVIETIRVGRPHAPGSYRFIPPAQPISNPCALCQPEPLQCAAC